MMKQLAFLAVVLAGASCRSGMSEPDDVETPTYNPSIQAKLLEDVHVDPPQGENIQYIVWSIDDHKALTPWLSSLSDAESQRRDWQGKHPLLTFTVLWRQNPAPSGGVLRVTADNH